jgi:hypothetical protein
MLLSAAVFWGCRLAAVLRRGQPAVGLRHHGPAAAVAHDDADDGGHRLWAVPGLRAHLRHGRPALQAPVGALPSLHSSLLPATRAGSAGCQGLTHTDDAHWQMLLMM